MGQKAHPAGCTAKLFDLARASSQGIGASRTLRHKALLADLERILDELDAEGLELVAVHVDTAICALKDAKL